jgi:anti-sigma B factor antagonist
MRTFPKTRAAAGYAARHARAEQARPRPVKDGEQAMDDGTLAVQVRRQSGYSIVTVAGEADIVTAPRLRERLAALAGAGRPVIADLGQVSFIDAAGLRVLATAARQAAGSGGSLHVVSDRYQVLRIFALTGLDRQIPLARTRAEALAAPRAGTSVAAGTGRRPARRARPGPPATSTATPCDQYGGDR